MIPRNPRPRRQLKIRLSLLLQLPRRNLCSHLWLLHLQCLFHLNLLCTLPLRHKKCLSRK